MGIYGGSSFPYSWTGGYPSQWDGLWGSTSSYTAVCFVLGGLIGILIPRPRWLEASGKSGFLFYVTPPGLFFRRAALVFHGAYIFREIWKYCTLPDATRGFWSFVWGLLTGNRIESTPYPSKGGQHHTTLASLAKSSNSKALEPGQSNIDWYVDESDLKFFKQKVEKDDPDEPAELEPMMDKDFGNLTYTAWRRKLKAGGTDYKSVTVASNATAEEFMDFYLDDPTRMHWDSMISHTEVLENGPSEHRCQVVRWIRQFPFVFISKREYVIARRIFRQHGCIYGITKAIEHPRAVYDPEIVRMDTFYSMWRSRTIPDPKGGDQPACETVLLHHEQFKIQESLARFAVKTGMNGFVKKMGPEVLSFVAERRQRVGPFEKDPQAFGVDTIPNPPMDSERTPSEEDDSISEISVEESEVCASIRRPNIRPRPAKRKKMLPKILVGAAIGFASVALNRRGNRQNLA